MTIKTSWLENLHLGIVESTTASEIFRDRSILKTENSGVYTHVPNTIAEGSIGRRKGRDGSAWYNIDT